VSVNATKNENLTENDDEILIEIHGSKNEYQLNLKLPRIKITESGSLTRNDM